MPILPILIKISYYPFDNFCFRFFLYLCGGVRVLTDYHASHMDGFKNIDIKNFRGIEHLNIDDFVRVNVFSMWSNLWIKAKDFAAEMTSVNVQAKDFHGENRITKSILITMLLYARC